MDDVMRDLVDQARQLSTYAAAVDWTGGPNTREWLAGLRDRIHAVQEHPLVAPTMSGYMTTVAHYHLDEVSDD